MTVDMQFTVKEEASEWSWAVGRGNLRMFEHGNDPNLYWTGEFVDPRGIATIYRQEGVTRIDFVRAGRCHSRSWKKAFGDRTIARLARAFITDLLS
jgi:hypothetical protein